MVLATVTIKKKKMKKDRVHISERVSNQTDEVLTWAPLTLLHKQIIRSSSSSWFYPKLSALQNKILKILRKIFKDQEFMK